MSVVEWRKEEEHARRVGIAATDDGERRPRVVWEKEEDWCASLVAAAAAGQEAEKCSGLPPWPRRESTREEIAVIISGPSSVGSRRVRERC